MVVMAWLRYDDAGMGRWDKLGRKQNRKVNKQKDIAENDDRDNQSSCIIISYSVIYGQLNSGKSTYDAKFVIFNRFAHLEVI